MKKLLIIALAILTCFCFSLTACGPKEPEHTHAFDKEVAGVKYLKDLATCQTKAVYYKSCECGERGTETFETGSLAEHFYVDGACQWCSAVDPNAPEDTFTGEVDQEDWLGAIKEELFDNVTIFYSYNMTFGGFTEKIESYLKIADGRVQKEMNMPKIQVVFENELAEQQKDMVLGLFLGFVAQYEDFEFNAEEGYYVAPNPVIVTVGDETIGYSVTETATNGKIKFADENTIEWFTCDLKEEINLQGEIMTSFMDDMYWEFSNFGQTQTIDAPDVDYIPENQYSEVTLEQWKAGMNIKNDCVIKAYQTTIMAGKSVQYMITEITRSGNVISFDGDSFITEEGDKYYEYFNYGDGYIKEEIDEEYYLFSATHEGFQDVFDQMTFDAETGLYVADVIENLGNNEEIVCNVKAGFVDGKLIYFSYSSEEEEDGETYVESYYAEYKTVDIVLPEIAD